MLLIEFVFTPHTVCDRSMSTELLTTISCGVSSLPDVVAVVTSGPLHLMSLETKCLGLVEVTPLSENQMNEMQLFFLVPSGEVI